MSIDASIVSMNNFSKVNAIYGSYFEKNYEEKKILGKGLKMIK